MKIVYHHRTLGDGAEGIHVREMIRAFRALGHTVRVIGPVGEAEPKAAGPGQSLSALKRLPRWMFECVEIAYSLYAFFVASFAILRFRPDFIYDRYMAFNAGVVLAGRLWRVPVLLEVNAPLALERSKESDEKLALVRTAFAMERWICARASRCIVVSTPLKDYLVSIGVPAEKCFVMANGVDPEKFAPREKNPAFQQAQRIAADRFVVGFTGVLREWHGLDLLVEACARVKKSGRPVFLLVVGDGPYRPKFEELVAQNDLSDSVLVTGRVRHEQVPDFVSLFDVAVSPRATFYASPMKVIEYMSLAKPVLVPRTPNFLDIVDENVNGATFRDGDAGDIARALTELCDAPAQRRALGEDARRKVLTRLNWRWNAAKSCELAVPA